MSNTYKKCSYCSEEIPADAGRCPFCGSLQDVVLNVDNTRIDTFESSNNPFENEEAQKNTIETDLPEAPKNEAAPTEAPKIEAIPTEAPKPEEVVPEAPKFATAEPGATKPETAAPPQNSPKTAYQRAPGMQPSYQPTQARVPASRPNYGSGRSPLSNGMKVFLTLLFSLIPGIGQLAGLITAIVFMNTDDDPDRKSFGVALLIAVLIMFVLACIGCFVALMVFSLSTSEFTRSLN